MWAQVIVIIYLFPYTVGHHGVHEVVIVHLHARDDIAISFDLAIETAQYYGITQKETEKIAEEISTTVRDN